MRQAVIIVALATTGLTVSLKATAQPQSSVPYSVPNRGAETFLTTGVAAAAVAGYARVQPVSNTATPSGIAILGQVQNGVLTTEIGEPGVSAALSGRLYVEMSGVTGTAVAIANPNASPVVVTVHFTDAFGNNFAPNSFVIQANGQIARFIGEAPFNIRAPFVGSLTFDATAPVGVLALTTLVNQRGQFLATAEPVISLPASSLGGSLLIGQFAEGGGWKTQVVLINTTNTPVSGTVAFFGEGRPGVPAVPLTLTVNGITASSFPYAIQAQGSAVLATSGATTGPVQVGSIQIIPGGATTAPSAFGVLSVVENGVTTSLATVPAQAPGLGFRSYVEVNTKLPIAGAIQAAVAIANPFALPATVHFELFREDGVSTGLTSSLDIPGFGHAAAFVHDLFPSIDSLFPATGQPFRGLLRITSFTTITPVVFRWRFNERGEFLITTMPSSNETLPISTTEILFPHIVDGGGSATQFILFSGVAGQSPMGVLSFTSQGGQALNLTLQ